MMSSTKLSVVCSLLEWMHRSKSAAKKRSKFRRFLDNFCSADDYFSAIRLLLPALDRHRGSYGLKESALAGALVDALALSRDSGDARRLLQWRKDSSAANAGNFSLVAAEVLARRQRSSPGDLTVGDLNALLDRLAAADSRHDKSSVLQAIIARTNAREMKWILMIILKDLKLGISEKSIFHEFHPDAEDLFNVTCDLKLVCDKLRDRSQRHKRQDIEVGKAVRPQLAMRVADAATAWKKLHGKEVVIECKLDGDRIQIHKNGTDINYFSRNFIDHSEYSHGMSDVIVQNVQADRCILDGEMLVWDTSLNRFAEFGSNQEIAKAAREGFDSDRQLCYVAFDILYVGDTSVIHRSLKERHELLQKVVKPVKGHLEILIPNGGLNSHRSPGEPCCSLIAHSVDEVERFFKETIDNREEGIVLKDLGSKWEPSDRSGKWLKLKPDYVRAGSDLDVLIVGGYYGSGRRGGEISQFLVGLAERPTPNAYPRRFLSFCRVGTGLSDEELDAVVNKLKPYFRKYEYPKKTPPSFYQVTNNSKERPDVWIDSPEKSIILAITSDIRTIRSEVFAAPYSLRFPRIDQVRYDKPWHECLDVQSFVELVQTSNGTTQRGKDSVGGQSKQKRTRSSAKEEKKNLSVVPSHMVRTDISGVKGDTLIFSGIMFYFVNVPPTHSLDSLHKSVAENGGTFSMNLNSSVTHCVAAESRGIKYQAAIRQGDVIHYSWVLDCCSQKKLLPLQPKYFLFLSDASKKKLHEEIDEFSDSYYWDLDLADIKQLLSSIDKVEDAKVIDHYKEKYGPLKWSHFHGCSIYLHASLQSLKPDLEALFGLTLRRLKVEVKMNGGKVTGSLFQATHVVVLWVPGFTMDLENVLKSFTVREKRFLLKGMLHVVQSQWLEDSLERNLRLPEETYSLKPMLEQLNIEEDGEDDMDVKASSPLDYGENQELALSISPNKERNEALEESSSRSLAAPKARKRGRPNSTKGNALAYQTRRTRAHIGRKPAKISANESDGEEERKLVKRGTRGRIGDEKAAKLSSDDDSNNGTNQTEEEKYGKLEDDASLETEREEDLGSPQRDVRHWFRKSPEAKMAENPVVEDGSKNALTREKIEIMTDPDPVHAMLLDMIPSLRKDKTEPASTSTTSTSVVVEDAAEADPTKKKKVSYKDLANQLLNDF